MPGGSDRLNALRAQSDKNGDRGREKSWLCDFGLREFGLGSTKAQIANGESEYLVCPGENPGRRYRGRQLPNPGPFRASATLVQEIRTRIPLRSLG